MRASLPHAHLHTSRLAPEPLSFVVIIAVAAPFFAFFGNGCSLWLDEAGSLAIVQTPVADLMEEFRNGSSPPFYYALLRIWVSVFGTGEHALRSLSGLFYLLTVLTVYVMGTLYDTQKRTGLICMFLYMVSPLAIHHAQSARPYALLGLLSALGMLCFIRLFFKGEATRKLCALYVVVHAAGCFTNYWFLFVIIAEATCVLALGRTRDVKLFMGLASSVLLLFCALWFEVFSSQLLNGGMTYLSPPGLQDFGLVFHYFAGRYRYMVFIAACVLFCAVLSVGHPQGKLRVAANLTPLYDQRQFLVYLIFFSVLLALPFIVSQKTPMYLPMRYTIAALPPLVMLIGILLARTQHTTFVLAALAFLCLNMFVVTLRAGLHEPQHSDRNAARYIADHARRGDILVFTNLSRLPVDHYLERLAPADAYTRITFPEAVSAHPTWLNFHTAALKTYPAVLSREAKGLVDRIKAIQAGSGHTMIWLFYDGRFYEKTSELVKQYFDRHFRLIRKVDVKGSANPGWYEPFFSEVFVYE